MVRSGPDTEQMRPIHPASSPAPAAASRSPTSASWARRTASTRCSTSMDELVHRRGRTDVHGDAAGLRRLPRGPARRSRTALGLDDRRHLHRPRRPEHDRRAPQRAPTIGLCPDLKTPLNDVSTMNKTMEYMAYALPVGRPSTSSRRGSPAATPPLRAVRRPCGVRRRRRAAARRPELRVPSWAARARRRVSLSPRLAAPGRRRTSASTTGCSCRRRDGAAVPPRAALRRPQPMPSVRSRTSTSTTSTGSLTGLHAATGE